MMLQAGSPAKQPAVLDVAVERWPIAGEGFTIARGRKTEAVVVVASITQAGITGRGECVPYARYGESVDSVVAALQAQAAAVASGADRHDVQHLMPPGAARNALDCALWALQARTEGRPVWALAGLPEPAPVVTAYTLSVGEPAAMARAAAAAAADHRPLLKVKLAGDGDAARIAAVRAAAPAATLIVDANESWTVATLQAQVAACAQAKVALIEQPLPAGDDAALEGFDSPVPLCADESFHGLGSMDGGLDRGMDGSVDGRMDRGPDGSLDDGLDRVARRYSMVNLKLDKTGGLTEAIAVAQALRARNMGIMVGCMLGTSLGMAPAFLLAPWANFVDLDGPLLLKQDRTPGFVYEVSTMLPARAGMWDAWD